MDRPGCKDRPTGLLERASRPVTVLPTGRCEPRRAYLALHTAVSNLERPVAPTPPSDGLLLFLRSPSQALLNLALTGCRLSSGRFGEACSSRVAPRVLRR